LLTELDQQTERRFGRFNRIYQCYADKSSPWITVSAVH
jgi:hypothetical protein